jgi:Autotransporter beta-domain
MESAGERSREPSKVGRGGEPGARSSFRSWLLSCTALLVASPAFGQNLVSNPGFEQSTTCTAANWTLGLGGACGPSYSFQSGPAHSGVAAYQFGNATFASQSLSQSIGGLGAGRYDFSFWYSVPFPQNYQFTASINGRTFTFSTAAMTPYVLFDQHVVLPAGTATIVFNYLFINGNPSGNFIATIDDVSLALLGPNTLTPLLPQGAPVNAANVAGGIDKFLNNGGTLPQGLQGLGNLSGQQLVSALQQLDGEASTDAEKGAFQLMNEFMGLMLDPFVDGRGNGGGGGATGFAPEQKPSLPPDIALAYDAVLKAPRESFVQRWSAWGSAYGGSNKTAGDPAVVGSTDVTAGTHGFAAGMDYRISPNTTAGFALAGAGTNWGLAQGLGGGRSDAFQAGVYGATHLGPAYLAGALAFADHWMTTNRTAFGGDQLTARFGAQSYGGRLEAGYRVAVLPLSGVTPYAAVQAQAFHTPAYSETDLTGGSLGLSYASASATDTRSELGARLDTLTAVGNMPLLLRGRTAWAHDWVSNPALDAVFQSLPGASFVVNGAAPPRDSALASASAELHVTPALSLSAKFDGEWAQGSQTYAGTGTLRYSW